VRRVTWHRHAQAEADDAFSWHLDRSPGTAAAFVDAVDAVVETLRRHPNAGVKVTGQIRRMALTGYPFVVVYRPTSRGIRILAFANTSREPAYWSERM
jgi:plasmid stabilization system protein ParE